MGNIGGTTETQLERQPSALCIGGAAWDELILLASAPREGELNVVTQRVDCAGGVARSALVLANLGYRVTLVSSQGNGNAGRRVRAELERRHIDCHFSRTEVDIVSTILLVDGERTILATRGDAEALDREPLAQPYDLVLCATSSTHAFRDALEAQSPQTLASYDAGEHAYPHAVEAATAAHIVTGKPSYFAGLPALRSGRAPHESCLDGARWLLSQQAKVVAITNGAEPVKVLTANESFEVQPPLAQALDTAGCGDVFHATLAGRMALGGDVRHSAEEAAAAAARHAEVLGNARI